MRDKSKRWKRPFGSLLLVLGLALVMSTCDLAYGAPSAGSDYPTNLENGSFEDPDKHTGSSASWTSVSADSVPSWRTTATDNAIEFGWVSSSGTSPHMTAKTAGATAADGYCFAETIAGEANSSLYHALSLSSGQSYSFSFAHRGRSVAPDTIALIIGPDQAYSFDKASASDYDPFCQLVSWLRESTDVEAPADGEAIHLTVYSTPLSAQGTFGTSGTEAVFSQTADELRTQEWQVYLCSSGNDGWNTFAGSFTAPADNAVMAFTPFSSAWEKSPDTAGNLIDSVSVTAEADGTVIHSASFEVETSSGYMNVTSGSDSIGGWCTTATAKKVEIGCLKKSNAYGLPEQVVSKVYVRDGAQFAELNANQESTLYQYISTESGKKYEWSLSHRGRNGVDTMALVIGPKQEYDPKKVSKNSRDQLMQIVDWVKGQSDVVIEGVGEEGCSERITLFTAPFNDKGGFTSDDPISWSKDDVHTEKWCLWIISSGNGFWSDYGYLDTDPDATYDYTYVVPQDSEESLFGFVSYQPAPKADGTIDYSYGNLVDVIAFDEYYHIRGSTTVMGEGAIVIDDESEDFTVSGDYVGWALSDSAFRIVATQTRDRAFLGAIINGSFVPVDLWEPGEADGTYSYDVTDVAEHYDIRLIFAAEHVIYDVNGGDDYHSDPDDASTGYEVGLAPGQSYTSHTATSDNDGWRFEGWKYTDADNGATTYDAEHTISYAEVGDTLSISGKLFGSDEDKVLEGIPASHGVTMVAQWSYRQRFAVQLVNESTGEVFFDDSCGTVSVSLGGELGVPAEDFVSDGKAVGQDYYVSDSNLEVNAAAAPAAGYRFLGWYDADGNRVSQSRAYGYQVDNRQVTTLYARFSASGSDVDVTKSVRGNYADHGAYFRITLSVSGATANKSYKVSVPDVRQVTPLEGGLVMSDSSIATDASGNGSATVYLKDGQTAIISDLPDGATYSVSEKDYGAYGYRDSYLLGDESADALEDVPVDESPSATVVNEYFTFGLQVAKSGLTDADDLSSAVPLSGAGFTLYSDEACTKVTHSQQLTDDEGLTTFVGMRVGKTYYLKESYVPTAYRNGAETIALKVKEDGIYLVSDSGDERLPGLSGDGSTFRIGLTNAVMLTLPSAGSAVTPHTLHLIGGTMLCAAALLLLFRMRRRPLGGKR